MAKGFGRSGKSASLARIDKLFDGAFVYINEPKAFASVRCNV